MLMNRQPVGTWTKIYVNDRFSDETMELTKKQEVEKTLPWDKLATSTGTVGLIITFVPYLSLIGILLCGFAIVAGIVGRKKKLNIRFSNLGICLGSVGLAALLVVIALITFL